MASNVVRLAPVTIAAAVLFTLAWATLARFNTGYVLFGNRIAPYNWLAQPVSGLGLGRTAFYMNGAFLLTALLLATGVSGIVAALPDFTPTQRMIVGGLLLLTPIGCALCGIFTLEQFMPHFIGFLLAAGTPVASFALLGWWLLPDPAHGVLARALFVAALITLILIIVMMTTFDPVAAGQGVGHAGLVQRLLITEVLGTFALVGWSLGQSAA